MMSCCISSAVCCSFLTASVSGIALGYNYSLAEYIDLKETNVSVYVKRGIFDDEIGGGDSDEANARRAGNLPNYNRVNSLRSGATEDADESTLVKSGRRLDDSIFESNDQNKFEGSLMRLTAKAPDPSTTTETGTPDHQMAELASKYPVESLDQLKAVQGLINMRKSGAPRQNIDARRKMKDSTMHLDARYLPQFPVDAFGPNQGFRRILPKGSIPDTTPINSLRLAVPEPALGQQVNSYYRRLGWKTPPPNPIDGVYDEIPTLPEPVTPRAGPVRPTRPKQFARPKPTQTTMKQELSSVTRKEDEIRLKNVDEQLDMIKNKFLIDRKEIPNMSELEEQNRLKETKAELDEYVDDVKGYPVRKRRNVEIFSKSNPLNETHNFTRNDNNNVSNTNLIVSDILTDTINISNKINHDNVFINKLLGENRRHALKNIQDKSNVKVLEITETLKIANINMNHDILNSSAPELIGIIQSSLL